MNACPNCGFRHANRDYAPEIMALPLPAKQRDVLLRLSQAQGGVVATRLLADFVYGDDEREREDEVACLRVHICNARKAIRSLGWTIKVDSPVGYRLVRLPEQPESLTRYVSMRPNRGVEEMI